MSDNNRCDFGEADISTTTHGVLRVDGTWEEAPPCPACEAVQNGPYTIDLGEGEWLDGKVGVFHSLAIDIEYDVDQLGYVNGVPGPKIHPDWSLTIVSPDDRHHAEILAYNLDQQGCTADAELVRRLAGLTGP